VTRFCAGLPDVERSPGPDGPAATHDPCRKKPAPARLTLESLEDLCLLSFLPAVAYSVGTGPWPWPRPTSTTTANWTSV
jgi:hypothetical protein